MTTIGLLLLESAMLISEIWGKGGGKGLIKEIVALVWYVFTQKI